MEIKNDEVFVVLLSWVAFYIWRSF
jgi:hypothetical protein